MHGQLHSKAPSNTCSAIRHPLLTPSVFRVAVGLAVLVGFCAAPSAAQSTDPGPDSTRPRVGVVLSGGSAKGFAHIGVLRVLDERGIPIDVVTGTSIGAIVGGLRASGLSVDSIESAVLRQDWRALFGERVERRWTTLDQRLLDEPVLVSLPFEEGRVVLPEGAIEGSAALALLETLTWPWAATRDFRTLPVPFAAVATDLNTGESVRLDGGVLPWALRASMAIPGAIAPFSLDGRLLVDGSVTRNLPATDALALGADFLICSDVSADASATEDLETLFDVVSRVITLGSLDQLEAERALCDILVTPDQDGLSYLDFDRAPEWIARGEQAARAALDSVDTNRLVSNGASPARAEAIASPLPPTIRLTRVRVEGLDESRHERILLDLLPASGSRIDADSIAAALDRISANGRYGRLRYRVDASDADTILSVQASVRSPARLGLGLRYDTHAGAALLFTGTTRDRLGADSRADILVRLGREVHLEASWRAGRWAWSGFGQGVSLRWRQAEFGRGVADESVAGTEVNLLEARGGVGLGVGRNALATLEGGFEWSLPAATSDAGPGDRSFASAGLFLLRETLDRSDFPRSGSRVLLRSEASTEMSGGDVRFHRHLLDAVGHLPLHPSLSLRLGLYLAAAGGDPLPLHHRIVSGGVNLAPVFSETHPRFAGLEPGERSGEAAQIGRAALVWEFRNERFAEVEVDVGSIRESWNPDADDFTATWAFTVGAASIVGPVTLTVHGLSLADPRLALAVGRVF